MAASADAARKINIDHRAYMFVRQMAVRNCGDAVIELVTNGLDAYDRVSATDKRINIVYDVRGRQLRVTDQATGVPAGRMSECFLQVGNYTSSEGSRGYFSRGAKDICALGDVTFESIHDGTYSRVTLDHEATGCLHDAGVGVTELHRTGTGIVKNGMCVTIAIAGEVQLHRPPVLRAKVQDHHALRVALQDRHVNVNLAVPSGTRRERQAAGRLLFTPAVSKELMVDLEYHVPGYEKYKPVRFTLHRSATKLKYVRHAQRSNHYGVLVRSESTCFEVSPINRGIESNPYFPYLFGELFVPQIDDFLRRMDEVGPTPVNPVVAIDPNRQQGLNREHPFVQRLFDVPARMIEQVLARIQDDEEESTTVDADIDDMLQSVEVFGTKLLEGRASEFGWRSNRTGSLMKAVEDTRGSWARVNKLAPIARAPKKLHVAPGDLDTTRVPDLLGPDSDDEGLPEVGESEVIPEPRYFVPPPYVYQQTDAGEWKRLRLLESGDAVPLGFGDKNTQQEEEHVWYHDSEGNEFMFTAQQVPSGFKLKFVSDPRMTDRYQIYRNGGDVVLRINALDEGLARYLGSKEDGYPGLYARKTRTILAELIADAVARFLALEDAGAGRIEVSSTTDPVAIINDATRYIDERKKTHLRTVYDVMLTAVDSTREEALAAEYEALVQKAFEEALDRAREELVSKLT